MKNKNYKVYIHTAPNGKVYIGITCQTVERRWRNGGYGYSNKGSEYFYNAILKYGWDNFKHEVISNDLNKEEAENLEKELIKKYKSNDKRYGYNILSGGYSPGAMPEETRKKVSESRKGKYTGYRRPEIGKAISKSKMGHTVSEDTKIKISNTLKGRYVGKDNPTAKPIICLETNEIFDCARDACRKYGICPSNLCNHLKGKRKSVNRLHFKYASTNND